MIAQQVSKGLDKSCLAKRCKRDGCSISMAGISSSKILINVDSRKFPANIRNILKGRKRCDFIFLGKINSQTGDWVIPLELKKGRVDTNEVVSQLQTGADIAEILVQHVSDISFGAVVASGRIDKKERGELRRYRVSFRGTNKKVHRIKCGSKLIESPLR